MIILQYKSDALICLERPVDESIACLDKAIQILTEEHLLELSELQQKELLNPKFKESNLIKLYNNKAMLLYCKDDLDGAICTLKQSLLIQPDKLEPNFNLCLLLLQKDRIKEACITWLKYRQIPLDKPPIYYTKLSQKLIREDLNKAVEPIESHVTKTVSLQQQLWMDLEILYHFNLQLMDQSVKNIFSLTEKILQTTE